MDTRLEKIKLQPLNEILGVIHISSAKGIGEIRATVNKATVNPSGHYHGGAIYTLCDVAGMAALSSVLEADKEAVTHDIHVSVMRPANENDEVFYKSKVTKLGKRVCFMEVEVTVKGKIIATARVTKSVI